MITEQKMLIIDDSEDDILIMKTIISKIGPGIRIEVASSGEEGHARLQKGNYPPALILLDVKMPGMSGIEVLRKIRSDKRLNYVHVAIVTNSIVQDDFVASYKSGANSILPKSGNADEFRKCIINLIDLFIEK